MQVLNLIMKGQIIRYTKEELNKMKGKTNSEKVRKTTDEEIAEQVKNDPDSYMPTDEELEQFKLTEDSEK